MIVDHERLEEYAVFFIDLTESIQQADKAVISLALCGEYLLQQGELALLDSREDILDSLKVNIESGTMDSGALYDFLYGNAPEFFFQIQIPECAFNFCSCAVSCCSIFGHKISPWCFFVLLQSSQSFTQRYMYIPFEEGVW